MQFLLKTKETPKAEPPTRSADVLQLNSCHVGLRRDFIEFLTSQKCSGVPVMSNVRAVLCTMLKFLGKWKCVAPETIGMDDFVGCRWIVWLFAPADAWMSLQAVLGRARVRQKEPCYGVHILMKMTFSWLGADPGTKILPCQRSLSHG